MDFPSEPPSECPAPDGLAAVVPSGWRWCGRNRMDWFVELDSPADLRGLRPDFDAIRALGLRGIVVTALGDQGSDFVSRFFAPQSGIPEDHATGSAHCALAPYWASRLGRNVLTGFQLSPRGAVVHVEDRDGRTTLKRCV